MRKYIMEIHVDTILMSTGRMLVELNCADSIEVGEFGLRVSEVR